MPQPRVRWSLVLALIGLTGCYPDPEKARAPLVGGMGGGVPDGAAIDGSTIPRDATPGPEVGPLLPPAATAENCTDFGVAWCEKSRQCQTDDYEGLGGGAVCATRMRSWCEALLTTPADTNWTAATFKTCITSWSILSCDDWRDFDLEILKGQSCFVPGRRGAGAGCWSFAQCGTADCAGAGACGTCMPRAPVDGACTGDSDCQRGLICAGTKKCVVPGLAGNPCSDARPCRRSLLCGTNQVCAPPLAEGQPCQQHAQCGPGLLCNIVRKVCSRAVAGDRCSRDEPDGSIYYCAGGGACSEDTLMCVRPLADNAACMPDSGPDCLWPASCAGGRCRLITPANCPAVPGGVMPMPMTTGPNNSASLSGPSIGSGQLANTELSRPLKVTVTTPNPRFEVGPAHAIGPGKAILWVIPVKSTAMPAEVDCGLSAGTIVLKDAAGAAIMTMNRVAGFVTGSIGIQNGLYTDNCLRGGETGYVFGIVTSDAADLYATVDSVELAITSAGTATLPAARVVPIAYKVADPGFSVTVRNDGTGPAKLTGAGLSTYVLLDDNGRPLDWSFLDTVTPEGPIAPGATAELTPSFFFFQGKAAKMIVLVDFEAP